ncbi:MAG: amidohydrolase [Bryobacteraceae bacterium]|jgi:5-methylthioadenosine/S-adenosylhomocysteine deaminase
MLRLFVKSAFICVYLWPILFAESADQIWTARYVVTMDPQRRVIENGAVAVRGTRILAVDTRAAIDRQYTAPRRLDRPEAVLIPGLIDTHTHAAMSLFRGIADDLTLQDWLEHYIFPAEARNVTPDFVLWGTRLACLEMMLSGTTTFTDMYYFEDRAAEATKEAGMRCVLGETIIGFPVPDAKTPADALAWTERYIQHYRNDPLVTPAVAPHALYTNSAETLRAARALANKYSVPLVIHLAETRRENDDCVKQHGARAVPYLASLGVFDGHTVAAHGVWLDQTDMDILRKAGVGIAHCPSSNMKLASGIAPVTQMLAMGIPVGLGPDGPAGSNNDFDLMEEMNLAADLQKVATGDPRSVPAEQALAMATILGARVLGLDKSIGSLEAGKLADMVMVRLDRPHAVPLYNIYSQLVYALKGSDVRDVMVNGRVIVSDANSLTLDSGVIIQKAREYRSHISESLQQQHTTKEISH